MNGDTSSRSGDGEEDVVNGGLEEKRIRREGRGKVREVGVCWEKRGGARKEGSGVAGEGGGGRRDGGGSGS
jgi:hypothetical protein